MLEANSFLNSSWQKIIKSMFFLFEICHLLWIYEKLPFFIFVEYTKQIDRIMKTVVLAKSHKMQNKKYHEILAGNFSDVHMENK